MKAQTKKAIQFIVFFGLGIGLMYWQFSRFTPQQKTDFFSGIKNAKYGWLLLAMFIGALAHLSRAIRWQQLLTPLNRKVGLGNRFYAVMIGYLANYGLPRSGEVIRCGMIGRSDDVPFGESFGTVVVERIIDTLCLLLVFLLVLLFEFSQLESLWVEYIWHPATLKFSALGANKNFLVIFVGGIILFFAALFFFRKKIGKLFTGKIGHFINGFKNGILSVRKVPHPGWFIFHSLFIWAGYLFSLYACFFCFSETAGLSLNTALILLLFGTFGVIFTPGGIGLYQIIVTGLLIKLYPNTLTAAASFSWLSWGAQVGTVILFCGISLAIKPILNRLTK